MGCSAPRSIQFTTGFGLTRFAHLGFAVFDGVNDRIIDEDIHPYIFPENDIDNEDITTVDFNWMPISWATQTAHPAMYICAMPIGNSGGKLTRIFCYDLVLKCWAVVDLPFAISTLYQARPVTSVAITLMGTFDDGALHRWQAGDDEWDNSIDTPGPSPVNWSVETPMVYNSKSQTGRIYAHQLIIRGRLTDLTSILAVQLKLQGEAPTLAQTTLYTSPNIQDGLFTAHTGIKEKVINLDGIISGSGAVELNSFTWQIKPEVDTVPMRLT